MKIIGLTRIRNEGNIIQDTLDHMASFCDAVFVYDDASDDNTVEICKNHFIVKDIIESKHWDKDRLSEEYRNRQEVLALGQQYADPDDWFVYMDADERIEFDFSKLGNYSSDVKGVKMKLFDFYITKHDKDLPYYMRKFMGKEYREILMTFRNSPQLKYHCLDQREVTLPSQGELVYDGYVKHYGKAVSIEEWEKTCDYYIEHFPRYSEKWKKRKGKAIHEKSDFGTELITWAQREELGIKL